MPVRAEERKDRQFTHPRDLGREVALRRSPGLPFTEPQRTGAEICRPAYLDRLRRVCVPQFQKGLPKRNERHGKERFPFSFSNVEDRAP